MNNQNQLNLAFALVKFAAQEETGMVKQAWMQMAGRTGASLLGKLVKFLPKSLVNIGAKGKAAFSGLNTGQVGPPAPGFGKLMRPDRYTGVVNRGVAAEKKLDAMPTGAKSKVWNVASGIGRSSGLDRGWSGTAPWLMAGGMGAYGGVNYATGQAQDMAAQAALGYQALPWYKRMYAAVNPSVTEQYLPPEIVERMNQYRSQYGQ